MLNESVRVIPARVAFWAERLKVRYGRITIRNQRTRWGSCSHNGNLSFNWRLVMAPDEVLDYVVIHELCHLKEMNHQKAFWKEVEEYCPDWRPQRRWLNQHRQEIHQQLDV